MPSTGARSTVRVAASLAEVRDAGAWGFTIGSAFFESRFAPGGSFEDNMMAVVDWLRRQ